MSLLTKFASVGGATLASRALGFVREALMAAVLGAGPVADAFFAAFRLPNFFRRFLAEGAFNSAFVPMFGEELEKQGRSEAEIFASIILSVLLPVLIVLTILAEIFMPQIVSFVIAPSFDNEAGKLDLTILLARIMFPYIAFISLMAMLAGILNVLGRYFLPAFAPVLLNVVLIGVLGSAALGEIDEKSAGLWLSIGVLIGGVLQLAMVFWAARREKVSLSLMRPRLGGKVNKFLVLALPTALAGGVVQVNLLVGQAIASGQAGAISMLQYADRLYQLPLGVIGIAIGVVLLPELSRAFAADDAQKGRELMDRSMEFSALLVLPASIALFVFAEPITALLFERGAFERDTTLKTAEAVRWFSVGLPAFMLIKVLTPAFFARMDTKTPMWMAALNALINIVLSLLLFPIYGHVGIAIATSIAAWFNAICLGSALLVWRVYLPQKLATKRLAAIVLASVLLWAVCAQVNAQLAETLLDSDLIERLFWFAGLSASAVIFYFGTLLLTGLFGQGVLRNSLRRKK